MDDAVFQSIDVATRLVVSGDDAATFLQGQFSNDLRRSESSPATYGLWLNHKGRVLGDSHVLQRGPSAFEIISRASPAAAIRERLETYIIADDVLVADAPGGRSALIVDAANTEGVLATLGVPQPGRGQFAEGEGLLVVSARCSERASWLVLGDDEAIARARDRLVATAVREVGADVIERRRIAAGIPSVPDELGPDDLPNEGGLDHDAISYTKGCYLGQEVMARLHNLGQVRRRLHVVRIDAGETVSTRAPLFHGEQKAGELRSAVALPEGGWIGLAMVSTHLVQVGAGLSLVSGGAGRVLVERLAEGRAP